MIELRGIVGALLRPQSEEAQIARACALSACCGAVIGAGAGVVGGPLSFAAAFVASLAFGGWIAGRLWTRIGRRLDDIAIRAEALTNQGSPESVNALDRVARALDAIAATTEALKRQMLRLSFVDPATMLANQHRLALEIDSALQSRTGGVVAVISFERLPKLLQTLTPDAASELIRAIAARLNDAAKSALASRIDPAEFGIFASGVGDADAVKMAHRLIEALNVPIAWRGSTLSLGASCGVAVLGKDGDDAQTLLRHARLALEAAQLSLSRIGFFTPALDRAVGQRLSLEREMRVAIENGEFRPYFQPKIHLSVDRIEGCEALARWIRTDDTIVSPARFIPVAEEAGLIGPLSDAIMQEACWKAAAWARGGRAVKVAVNISAVQFRDPHFAKRVLHTLEAAGLAADLLELEITESTMMADSEAALRAIAPLREAGVRFAIDDFGCGHSSLAVLARLPFDVIKIDQQFVRALARGEPQSGAIVEAILALGKTLGMETVAEGVERAEEAMFMKSRGCDWAQGFLYSAAVPAKTFAELLAKQRTATTDVNAA